MDFTYSEEQDELRALVRDFLVDRSPESAVREAMAGDGYDWSLWHGLVGEIGVQGVSTPEEFGGLGLGNVALGIVLEELGRALACVPYFSTVVLAGTVLRGCAAEPYATEVLTAIATGSSTATVAVSDDGGAWTPEKITTTAIQDGTAWRVSGVKNFVLDGHVADVLVVAAIADGRPALFAVHGNDVGVQREALPMMDLTRRFATVTLDDAPARLIAADALPHLDGLFDTAISALAAEQIGGADRCIELSVEYAKTRMQFGRPIGSFQGIKHKCADMLIQVEAARAATAYALWCLDEEPAAAPVAAGMAQITAASAFFRAAADTIQIHGGIGFTWEHSAHLYFKRAKSSELWLGDPPTHRARLGHLLGLEPAQS